MSKSFRFLVSFVFLIVFFVGVYSQSIVAGEVLSSCQSKLFPEIRIGWVSFDEEKKEYLFLDSMGRESRIRMENYFGGRDTRLTSLLGEAVELSGKWQGNFVAVESLHKRDIYENNPLLVPSGLPFGVYAFDRIKPEDFLPAVRKALDIAQKNVSKIADATDTATFENTLVALEEADTLLNAVTTAFSMYVYLMDSEAIQRIQGEIVKWTSPFYSRLTFNKKLFARINDLYERRGGLNLNSLQMRLLDETRRGFVETGALLQEASQRRLMAVRQRLGELSSTFASNTTKSENSFEMFIEDEREFEGFPSAAVEAAKVAAQAKGRNDAWLVNLSYPSYLPFMRYSRNSELREKLWRASASVASSGGIDNRPLILEIVQLKHEMAQLLGGKNFATLTLKNRMAQSPERVMSFLEQIRVSTREGALADLERLRDLREKLEGTRELRQWDVAYYSRLYEEEAYQFDRDALKPYFSLDRVLEGTFLHLSKLFGLRFRERRDIPTFHSDQRVFEVTHQDGTHVGVMYFDPYPREGKASGAWAAGIRSGETIHGQALDRHIFITTNFPRPTDTTPSLLTLGDVQTFFHEMGHGIHTLLSQVPYASFAGTSVKRDFVEFPSQIMENWVREREVLDTFAFHYQTGELLPDSLLKKLKNSESFMKSTRYLRQASLAWLDMTWTTTDPKEIKSVDALEAEASANFDVFAPVEGALTTPHFDHIFGGGYSAGYYGYLWAEVLDADAFSLFKESGNLYDPVLANRLVETILSRGGSEDPLKLFVEFLGRDPDPSALIRRINGN